jgi:hypothetical protein
MLKEAPMKRFEPLTALSPEDFRRDAGISLEQFMTLRDQLVADMAAERRRYPIKNRGKQVSRLTVEDKLLLTMTYVRHYPTFQQLGQQFGISESYAHKLYERYRDRLVRLLRLPGHKAGLAPGLLAVFLDVTEQPIERPTRHQRAAYSGKKKRHTVKAQLLVAAFSLQILTVVCGLGRTHDFTLFKQARLPLAATVEVYADSGYQGIHQFHAASAIPVKASKHHALTADERAYNRALARLRIAIEHVNRRCKIFRIVKETYRGKHRQMELTWHLVAGLVNLRYA